MIVLVVVTQLPWAKRVRMTLWGFLPLGAFSGFLASVMGIPGPFAPGVLSRLRTQAPRVYGDLFAEHVPGTGPQAGGLRRWRRTDYPASGGPGTCRWALSPRAAPTSAPGYCGGYRKRWFAIGVNVMVFAFGVLFLVAGG